MGLLAVWTVAACGLVDETPTYRYRLTVEVDMPDGLRTGSSVIEVDTRRQEIMRYEGPGVHYRVRGEAAAVHLPGGNRVFALLRSEDEIDWASRVMFMLASEEPRTDEDSFQSRFDNMLKLTGPIVLPRTWPPVGACRSVPPIRCW